MKRRRKKLPIFRKRKTVGEFTLSPQRQTRRRRARTTAAPRHRRAGALDLFLRLAAEILEVLSLFIAGALDSLRRFIVDALDALRRLGDQALNALRHRKAQTPDTPARRQAEAPAAPRRRRSGASNARRRRAARVDVSRLLIPVLSGIIMLCVLMIASILIRTVRTKRLNAELAALHAESIVVYTPEPDMPEATPIPEPQDTPLPAPTAEPIAAPSETPAPEPTASTVKEFHRASGTALAHMETLYNQNHDLIGWLEIPDVIDLPVMYRDNTYYLTHDFNKKKNTAGTVFLDQNHRFSERTQNLLLHGHNMKDGTMFGRLVQYIQSIDYFRAHPFVNYDTLWEEETYVIFAVLNVSLDVHSDRFINYFSHPTFSSSTSFDAYVRQLQLSSVYAIPIDVQSTDALLTLSTCLDDDRLVIVCRRIRENESRSHLRELVREATHQ